jgi:ATP sulfurylase
MELKLNKAKVNHLLGLLEVNEREGWYYGNKEHYLKRHNELKTELKLLIASVVKSFYCEDEELNGTKSKCSHQCRHCTRKSVKQ